MAERSLLLLLSGPGQKAAAPQTPAAHALRGGYSGEQERSACDDKTEEAQCSCKGTQDSIACHCFCRANGCMFFSKRVPVP